MLGINDSSNSQRVHTANQQWCRHQQRRSEKRRAGNTTGEQGAEVDHGVGEGRGVEDLPGVDLVGAELVGGLHPRRRRRRERGRGGGRGGARVRQAVKEAWRRSEWEGDGTRAQQREHLDGDGVGEEKETKEDRGHSYGLEVNWHWI